MLINWAFMSTSLLTIYFLDVGQGDCAVIVTPSGKVIMIDSGPKTRTADSGYKTVLPFLRSHGINKIDALEITHPDEDHFGGGIAVLSTLPVKEMWISGISTQNPDYSRLLDIAKVKGTNIRQLSEGDRLDFHDGVSADILNPSQDLAVSHNNGSIAMLLKYGSTSCMFTGDEEKGAEEHTGQDFAGLHADVPARLRAEAGHSQDGSRGAAPGWRGAAPRHRGRRHAGVRW